MDLPKIIAVGVYDSKIASKNIVTSRKRITSMFEIELPISNGGISYNGSNSKRITPNMIICAKPGQVRYTRFPFNCYYVRIILHSGILYDILMNAPDFFESKQSEEYKHIFQDLIDHYSMLSDSETVILQSLILKLIYTISNDTGRMLKIRNSMNNSLIIEEALKYINEHLEGELSLEKVSKCVSLSPIHFHNVFKASVGRTLREYVEDQRIKKAIDLMLTTNDSLTEIAYKCGFSSQSYFSFAFKRKMKITPREYVREIYSKYEL